MTDRAWLPADWAHPLRVRLTDAHHLRPVGPADIDLDLAAIRSTRERLWAAFGQAWGWPRADLTREDELDNLIHHAAETEAHESFVYGLFDAAETAMVGTVYVDPPAKVGADADISWWVAESAVGGPIEAALDAFVPAWITGSWPFANPRFVTRDLSWAEWLTLPDLLEENA